MRHSGSSRLLPSLGVALVALLAGSAWAKDPVKHVEGGIVASFNQRFLNEYRTLFNTQFMQTLETMLIPAVSKHFELPIFNVDFYMGNISLQDAIYDPLQTQVTMHGEKPNFVAELVNCSLGIGFNYSIQTAPALINDQGTGEAWLRRLNIVMKGSPYMKDSFFQLDIDTIDIQMDDFGLDVQGGDLAFLADFFDNYLKSFVAEYLIGKVNEQAQTALESVLNEMLKSAPHEFVFDNDQVAIDYSLVNDGVVVTDSYFAVVMDGTVHLKNESEASKRERERLYNLMPAHDPDLAEVQIMISEYSLNTILLTAAELDSFEYRNSNQTSQSIQMLIGGFEETYGESTNVTIVAKASTRDLKKYRPSIQVMADGSLVEFFADIYIKNPLDESLDAAYLLVKGRANVTFSVDDQFELRGSIHGLDLTVEDFEAYFNTNSNIRGMNLKLTLAIKLMESYVNAALEKGWKLPVPANIAKYVQREQVVPKDGHLLVEGDCNFDEEPSLSSATGFVQRQIREMLA